MTTLVLAHVPAVLHLLIITNIIVDKLYDIHTFLKNKMYPLMLNLSNKRRRIYLEKSLFGTVFLFGIVFFSNTEYPKWCIC